VQQTAHQYHLWPDGIIHVKEFVPASELGPTSLQGYQEIKCHMIFDIKMDGDFTMKAMFVAGGLTKEAPASTTYSSVVPREKFRIAFLNCCFEPFRDLCCRCGECLSECSLQRKDLDKGRLGIWK